MKSTQEGQKFTPLAERMRPKDLEHFYGQEHLMGEGKILVSASSIRSIGVPDILGAAGFGKDHFGLSFSGTF